MGCVLLYGFQNIWIFASENNNQFTVYLFKEGKDGIQAPLQGFLSVRYK